MQISSMLSVLKSRVTAITGVGKHPHRRGWGTYYIEAQQTYNLFYFSIPGGKPQVTT